jgi:hypothetical protein
MFSTDVAMNNPHGPNYIEQVNKEYNIFNQQLVKSAGAESWMGEADYTCFNFFVHFLNG